MSFCQPYSVVSSKTLARWTTTLLSSAGVDTSIWKAHSTRSAAALSHSKQLSVMQLHKLADWSTSSGTFKKFYEKYL